MAQDLAQLERLDPSLRETLESADALTHQIDELARTIRSYRDSIVYSPERLQELEGRLDLIRGLKRKYGSTIEEILAFAERAAEDLDTSWPTAKSAPKSSRSDRRSLGAEVGALAGQLSEARRDAAVRLAGAIEGRGRGTWRPSTSQMHVDVRQSASDDGVSVEAVVGGESAERFVLTDTGVDSVEFLISLNLGEPPRPLARIASGGERPPGSCSPSRPSCPPPTASQSWSSTRLTQA